MKRHSTSEAPPHHIFGFPYEPYDIQRRFVEQTHLLLEEGGLGIFESPTGTGKTLSILCSTIYWVQQNETKLLLRHRNDGGDSGGNSGAPIWVLETLQKKRMDEVIDWKKSNEEVDNRRKQRAEEYKLLAASIDGTSHHLPHYSSSDVKTSKLQKFNKSDVVGMHKMKPCTAALQSMNKGRRKTVHYEENNLIEYRNKLLYSDEFTGVETNKKFQKMQIIICSRTHSQLSQYVDEIRKTKYANTVKMLCMGSRQQLCVNNEAKKLAMQSNYINDVCRKLTEDGKCEYKKNAAITMEMALSEPLQIEQLVGYGSNKNLCSCPYFGCRDAANEADVLLLPYNCILHEETMTSLALSIEDNILIFDEAHNIINAINAAGSCYTTKQQILNCYEDVGEYIRKYGKQFGSETSFLLKQLQRFCDLLLTGLSAQNEEEAFELSNLLVEWNLDKFDLHLLNKWLRTSGISQKLRGFSESYRKIDVLQSKPSNTKETNDASYNSIFQVHQLISCFLSCDEDDRILIYPQDNGETQPQELHGDKTNQTSKIEVLCLSAEKRFRCIVDKAHAVMLVGGTMEPRVEFSPLYSTLPKSKIKMFSSPHIVPRKNVFTITLSKGASEYPFDFRFQKRDSKEILQELGETILEVISIVPGGCIVFFPSFQFLNTFCRFLDDANCNSKLKSRISNIKRLFIETRAEQAILKAGQRDGRRESLLQSFASCVRNIKAGALLLSVMNGRLSEGVNFSDDLARCVMIVGMPYPNEDLRLKERMKYYDRKLCSLSNNAMHDVNAENSTIEKSAVETQADQFVSGVQLKNIMAIKSVNQCIGRAIRHRKDYASILLLDQRYDNNATIQQLPLWVRESLLESQNKCKSKSGKALNREASTRSDFTSIKECLLDFFEHMKVNAC